jgi:hypothetical protein
MRYEPQANAYAPDPQILALASWLGDPVAPADFPSTTLRWRNDRWARTVGLDALDDGEWVKHFGRSRPWPIICRNRWRCVTMGINSACIIRNWAMGADFCLRNCATAMAACSIWAPRVRGKRRGAGRAMGA